MVTQGVRGGGIGIDIYTVLYIKQITNTDLLCSAQCNGLYEDSLKKKKDGCMYLYNLLTWLYT